MEEVRETVVDTEVISEETVEETNGTIEKVEDTPFLKDTINLIEKRLEEFKPTSEEDTITSEELEEMNNLKIELQILKNIKISILSLMRGEDESFESTLMVNPNVLFFKDSESKFIADAIETKKVVDNLFKIYGGNE